MSGTPERPSKAFSCVRCFERKVKCDKQNPCSHCVKSRVECVFRVPPPPRRRKKRTQEEVLVARLKRCEELLKSKGIDIDSPQSPTGLDTTSSMDSVTNAPLLPSPTAASSDFAITHTEIFPSQGTKGGQLLVDHGKSRFIENNLWTSLSNEVRISFAPGKCCEAIVC